MIGFQVIFISSRRIVLEMEEEGTYYTDSPYEIYLDGDLFKVTLTFPALEDWEE